ncbi:SH3 domain-containing protein [Streptomyces minutiscleroticus]|uniref:SH3b domain-containing protein n=1 Tax=Streptomyces minutiscleroticus TaxID=68238 RepID=A0A918NYN8_9ACTN|nr:SH3 domain-containing protein [Streptomyces minutiscleroticus]GGY07599.1 hypothetical protein GCM10010358_70930 [Streptomyces minutiscleroticus]
MHTRLKMLGLGLAAATAVTLVQAPAASAATKTWHAQESVRIRAKTSTSSTALGLLPKGAAAAAEFKNGAYVMYFGGVHNACGSKGTIADDRWAKVTYKGITGYVAWNCMD